MRLGERSTRIRIGAGRQLILPLLIFGLLATSIAPLAMASELAPADAGTVSVGPGRIVCNASFCEMGSGARPKQRVRVIVSALPGDDRGRLRKCTGVAKPCIVSVDGTPRDGPMNIMASAIHWEN